MRYQTKIMKKIVKENDKCELCGSKRNLEAHHIIPIALGGEDIDENILCVCEKCHTLLTPRKYLTKLGIRSINRNYEYDFFKYFNEMAESGEMVTAIDVIDYVEHILFPEIEKRIRAINVKGCGG